MTYKNSVSVVLGVFNGRHFPIARTNVRADDSFDDALDRPCAKITRPRASSFTVSRSRRSESVENPVPREGPRARVASETRETHLDQGARCRRRHPSRTLSNERTNEQAWVCVCVGVGVRTRPRSALSLRLRIEAITPSLVTSAFSSYCPHVRTCHKGVVEI